MDTLKQKVFDVIERVESGLSSFYRINKEGYTPREIRMLLDKFPDVDASVFAKKLSECNPVKITTGEEVYIPSDVKTALFNTLVPKE